MRYPPGTKLAIFHAPPGIVSHGPSTYFDHGEIGEYSLDNIIKQYEEMGWTVTRAVVTE